MSQAYIELPIDKHWIFRIDHLSEYGFFYNSVTGDLNLCQPALAKFIMEEVKQKPNTSFPMQMLNNLTRIDEEKIPSLDQITLYVTDKCNLSCLHCWMDAQPTGAMMDIPLDRLLSFIDQGILLGLKRISIGGGEPLTWRPLPDFLRAVSLKNIRTFINTNGTLVSRDIAAMFAALNIHISLSLDSHIEDVHDRLRGARGTFKKAYGAIELFNKLNVPYELVTCVYKENLGYIREFFQWCIQVGIKRIKLNPIVNWGRGLNLKKTDLLLDSKDLIMLSGLIYTIRDISIMPSLPHCVFPLDFIYHHLNKGFCDLKHTLSLEPDGYLSVCGPASRECGVKLGNLGDNLNLAELWTTHPFILNVLRETPRQITGVCRNCIFSRSCFGFCKVITYGASNSWVAPYPLCIQLYESQRFPEIYLHN